MATSRKGRCGLDHGTVGCVTVDIDTPFVARAAVFARASIVVEVEFTNFRFNPTLLKVCKIAGTPNLLGNELYVQRSFGQPDIAQPGWNIRARCSRHSRFRYR